MPQVTSSPYATIVRIYTCIEGIKEKPKSRSKPIQSKKNKKCHLISTQEKIFHLQVKTVFCFQRQEFLFKVTKSHGRWLPTDFLRQNVFKVGNFQMHLTKCFLTKCIYSSQISFSGESKNRLFLKAFCYRSSFALNGFLPARAVKLEKASTLGFFFFLLFRFSGHLYIRTS